MSLCRLLTMWTGIICLFSGLAATSCAQTPGTLLFEDYFDGPTLDSAYWNPFVTDDAAAGWPWNNQRGQSPESSAVDRPNGFYLDYDLPSLVHTGSGLKLIARTGTKAEGFSWSSAVISAYPDANFTATQGFTFDDAYVEVRARLPYTGNGSWPAIWFLAAPGSSGAEIDLQEGGFLDGSADPDRIFACHLNSTGNVQYLIDTGMNLSAGYHTYAMAYKQGSYVNMYLDGKQMCSYTKNIPTGAYFIILNNGIASANTASWHSQVNATTASPNQMRVGYVKVYSLN